MGKSRSLPESMSKADLKFEKKHQFYTEVRDTVAALSAQKAIEKKKKLRSRQKKLKAYDLSSLSEFLPELKTLWQPSPAAQFKLNCKSMQKLILKEGQQLSTVLNHLLSSWIPWLPFFNTYIAHKQLQMRNQRKRRTKMEGRRKKRRNLRLQMDLNLWLCVLKDKFLSICFYEPYLFISNTLMPTF